MSKIKVTFVETNCKKNGPIKQTLNIIRNMDKGVFEPSLVTVWPELCQCLVNQVAIRVKRDQRKLILLYQVSAYFLSFVLFPHYLSL